MTRPIYEPTVQRQIRSQGYGGEQLFRRPAPPTGETIGGQWCRLGMSADFDYAPGNEYTVDWDVMANNFPDYYDVVNANSGGTDNAILILVDGVYAVTFGMYLDIFTPLIPTNANTIISFDHTTWSNEEEGFPFLLDNDLINELSSPILTGTKVFRSGPTGAYRRVWMNVALEAGADSNLGFVGGDLNTTYMEIVRLSSVDPSFQGDPNDFVTT